MMVKVLLVNVTVVEDLELGKIKVILEHTVIVVNTNYNTEVVLVKIYDQANQV